MTLPLSMRVTKYSVTILRGFFGRPRPPRLSLASRAARKPCCRTFARAGSSGLAQPCLQFCQSRSAPKVFSQPGGAMFRLLPV